MLALSILHLCVEFPPLVTPPLQLKVKVDIEANHVVNQLIRGEGHPIGCLESRVK